MLAGVLVSAVAGGLLGSTAGAVIGAAPASAAWSASAAATTSQLRSADLGALFEARTAATPVTRASPYAASQDLAGGALLVDVVSTSSVRARVSLVATTGGVLGAAVAVKSCAVPWTGTASTATCQPGAVDVAATAPLAVVSTASASWTADLPAGGRQFLRVTRGATLGTTTLTAAASPWDVGRDRTLG